jgi:hypothetical protein
MIGAAPVLSTEAAFSLFIARAFASPGDIAMLTAPALTLMFMLIVAGLGTAFVWMFWEVEKAKSARRIPGSRPRGERRG